MASQFDDFSLSSLFDELLLLSFQSYISNYHYRHGISGITRIFGDFRGFSGFSGEIVIDHEFS